MKERSIIMTAAEVRATLEGRKTQIRRAMKPQPSENMRLDKLAKHGIGDGIETDYGQIGQTFEYGARFVHQDGVDWVVKCPYQPGDRLWVKESHYLYGRWVKNGFTGTAKQKYRFIPEIKEAMYSDTSPAVIATQQDKLEGNTGWFKRNSPFMPRWASRITLEVTAVRVERLQNISEGDAVAEGCSSNFEAGTAADEIETAREQFLRRWDEINARRGFPSSSNPWVFAYTYKLIDTI